VKSTLIENKSYKRMAAAVVVAFAIIRGVIAFSMELGVDEAYYWFYSQDIKWTYFDHPPLVAIWIRIFTANLLLQDIEGFIRLGSVVGCAISSWAIFQTCTAIHSAKAGLFGVCLYNASFYVVVTTGIFIMPDTPQMVFYTIALWTITQITKDEKNWIAWITFGVAAGLCIMSKVYGAFLWFGLGLFVLLKKREWLSQPRIYVAALLTAVVASPILLWNIQHDFLMFRFHTNRFAGNESMLDLIEFLREALQQLLYNNPVNVMLIVVALIAYLKGDKTKELQHDALSILNFIALPLALLLLGLALFRDLTLPHWSGQSYVALIPLAAIYLASRTVTFVKKVLIGSLGSLLIFLGVWQYLVHFEPALVAMGADKKNLQTDKAIIPRLAKGFISFQLMAESKNSWKPADEAFLQLYRQDPLSNTLDGKTPVICYDWGGAHIEYYFGHPNDIPVIGLGDPNELHEYLFSNAQRKGEVNLNTAYCIVPADDSYDVQAKYTSYYHQIDKPSLISVKRKGKPDERFYVYRLRGWKQQLPMLEKQ